MARNISATVQIGATMASSVGAVFGRVGKQIDTLGGSLSKLRKQSSEVLKLQAAQGKLAEAKAKGNATATARYTAQVEKLSTSLTAAGVDTSQLTKEQERLAKSIGEVEKKLGQFKRVGDAFSKLKTDAKAVGDAFGGLKDKLGGAFTRLGIAGGVIGGAIAGVGYLTAEFVDQGDALADQAEGLNMSTKALQTWQFAAGTVGIESEKLGSILSKLQSKISEGSDDTKESFATLGLSYSKLKRMEPEQQLTHITEAFARLPKSVNKTALANKIFGKSGYKLLPVLNAGAAGLKDVYDQAKKTGYILSDDTNDAVNKADAAFNQFKNKLIGFKNQALGPLLPVFTDMIDQLGKIIEEHGPKFTTWIQNAGKGFMEDLAPKIGDFVTNDLPPLIDNIGKVVTALTDTATWLADVTGGWDNLAIGLVALNFVPVIASVVSLTSSLWSLSVASWAVLGPWGLLALAGIGAVVAVVAFRKEIREWMDSAPGWAKTIGHYLLGPIGNLIVYWDKVSAAVTAFKTSISSAIDSAVEKIESLMAKLRNLATLNIGGISFGDIGGTMLDLNPITGPARLGKRALEALMPSEQMPTAGAAGTVNNNVNVQITAPNADGPAIERHLRTNLPKRPLYDTTGVLVPQ
jgi:hypothetical protein